MENNTKKLLAKLSNICKRKKGNTLKVKLEELSLLKKLPRKNNLLKH